MLGTLMGLSRRSQDRHSTGYKLTDSSWWPWGGKSKSGAVVNEDTALGVTGFFCGISKIADTLKMMPLDLRQRLSDGGNREADGHPAAKLWRIEPSEESTVSRIKWLVAAWVKTWGNFYANIEWNENGDPIGLYPVHPSRVSTRRDQVTRKIIHHVRNNDGRWVKIKPENMLHVYQFSRDGITGMGCIGLCREALGHTVAVNEYGAKYFGNNAMPAHLVIRDEDLGDAELKAFRQQWVEANSGDKAGGVFFMGGGSEATKVQTLTLTNEDSQFLQSREFQNVEIARMVIISPFKIYDYGRATWGNGEQVALEYIGESVMPIAVDLEQECDRKLLRPSQRETHYFRFNPRGQLRAEMKSQYEAFTAGLNNGFLCVDEVRAMLDMNPLPDGQGKIYMRQANMVSTAELAAKIARIKSGTASEADVQFMRDVVKAFIADGTIGDVVANNTRIGDLIEAVGLPRETKVADPLLPVIADNGQPVSGETVKDSEGDVVGGGVVPADNAAPVDGGGTNAPSPPPTAPPSQARSSQELDESSAGDDTARAAAAEIVVMGFEPVLHDAILRMGRVESNASKRWARAADADEAEGSFWKEHELTVNGAFGVVFDAAGLSGGAILGKAVDPTAIRGFTARAAAQYVVHGGAAGPVTARSLLSCFVTEVIR